MPGSTSRKNTRWPSRCRVRRSPQLYAGSSRDFITDATRNQIAGKLRSAFVDTYHAKPSLQEVQSWQNSLLQMANALQTGSLDDQGILLEYQLPLSSRRLDCMITGHDVAGQAQSVIVELKQWGQQVEPSNTEGNVAVWVAGHVRDVLHPSQQVYQYEQYLRDVHSVFIKGEVGLQSCAFGVSVLDAYDATDRYVGETAMSQRPTIHDYAHPSTCGHTT
jgi:hypothetical protein